MADKQRPPGHRRSKPKSHRVPWWRHPLLWVGSVASALVIAMATAFGTGVGQDLWASASEHSTPPSGPAVRINQEIRNPPVALDTGTIQAWVLPFVLSPASTTAKVLAAGDSTSGYETPDSYIDRFDNWLFAHGGATVGATYLRITLTAGQEPIIIQSICAHIVSRTKIMSGTLFFKGTQGEKPVETVLNLDSAEPCATYFQGNYLSIFPGNSKVVDLGVIAHADTVAWTLFLDAIVNGRQEFIPVDSNEVLRTTGLLPKLTGYGIYYEYTTGEGYSWLFRPTVLGPGDQQSIENILSPAKNGA
jgi:hypothetical protein